MSRTMTPLLSALGLGMVLALVVPTTANATAPDEADSTASSAAQVNPDASAAIDFAADLGSASTDVAGVQSVEVASDGDTSISFSVSPADAAYLEIVVDQSQSAGEVEVASDGQAVALAAGDAPDVVVSATQERTSIQTVLESPADGNMIRYEFVGSELRLLDDGGVEAYQAGVTGPGVELVLAQFAAPWAFDANGTAVNTWYSIDGSTLTQHVDVNDSTSYPVVADPYQYNGLSYPQIRFSWAETVDMNANKGNPAVFVGLCGLMGAGSWLAAGFTVAVCAANFVRWANGIGSAWAANRCFAVNFNVPGPNPGSYACRKS